AVAREIRPGLPSGEVREHLQAGAEEAKLRWRLELTLEPLPLALAQHRCAAVGIADVWPGQLEPCGNAFPGPGLVVGAAEVERHERRAVVAHVRQDHLHALPRRAEHIGCVDAVPPAAR